MIISIVRHFKGHYIYNLKDGNYARRITKTLNYLKYLQCLDDHRILTNT